MKPWTKLTNEEMALNLALWLDLDGKVSDQRQVDFFQEVIWRLRLMREEDEKRT